MLDSNYIKQIKTDLTKHYRDNISERDEHHVTIFTNPASDNALPTYHPYNLDDQADNDSKVMPVRDVIVSAITQDQHG